MNPTLVMLSKFALAGAAGGLVGYVYARKSPVQGALLGASAVMTLYAITKERLLAPPPYEGT
jgi:membrane associated rhomboid family serine protease